MSDTAAVDCYIDNLVHKFDVESWEYKIEPFDKLIILDINDEPFNLKNEILK